MSVTGVQLSVAPVEVEQPEVGQKPELDVPWVTIVWNDPVNLMSYVVLVFMKVLAFNKEKATRHMMEVHNLGKSLVATNLALTLSESYRRQVLLVDADLRRPSLHRLFRMLGAAGLNEGLKAQSDEKLALVRISETLTLLPAAGPRPIRWPASRRPACGTSSTRRPPASTG